MAFPRDSEPLIAILSNIRTKNNILWMDIVRIAMKYAPDESRAVFKRIEQNDKEMTRAIHDFYGEDG